MTQDTMWQAVLARDSRADGAFVYAVRSTGIYCRPSCPSRRPARQRVSFFPGPSAAARAGFRPCRRCRPERADIRDPRVERVGLACHYLKMNRESPLTLAALAAHVGGSPHHLQRTFTELVGISPRQYAEACRLGRLKVRLRAGQPVASALYEAGYGSSSRLYEKAPAALGMTPAMYRHGGSGMRIRYTVVDSVLGRLLVAATTRGICAVKLGGVDAALEADLRRQFPAADLARDVAGLGKWVQPLVDHLRGRQPHLDLPVDVQATAFQRRVWQQLQAIPSGDTRSYSAIARAIGQPTATRAVARACATNPVALIVPCHRVVRTGRGLGGYRWGVARKQALLARERRERQAAPDGQGQSSRPGALMRTP